MYITKIFMRNTQAMSPRFGQMQFLQSKILVNIKLSGNRVRILKKIESNGKI